ncbi:CANX family protein [Megaselia abdita]
MRWKLNYLQTLFCCFIVLSTAFATENGKNEYLQEESIDVTEELMYESPQVDLRDFYFIDHFDDSEKSEKKWIKSKAHKDDTAEEIAKYDGVWNFEAPERIVWKNDLGLVLKSKAKHAAISSKLYKKFDFTDKPLVVQYEVTMQNIQDCGGSYIKLLSEGKSDLTQFNDKTPYTIMFGPDKCGNDIKLHFIFRHVNPINGSITEKHSRKPKERLEEPFKDKLPHLYQLVINPDNTFQVSVDHKMVNEGSLLSDFTPPVNPPKEIDDPEDKKPENWDEREKIPDPDAVKPEEWDEDAPAHITDPSAIRPSGWLEDEPEMIKDPNAQKPDDWDTDMDGEWEAPLIDNPICEKASGCGEWKAPQIDNPEYKGKWRAPLIDNPNYQGKWSPKKIVNPDFFEDLNPFRMIPITAVGIEIWSMSNDILFDNIIITDDVIVANEYAEKTFDLKRKYINKESESVVTKLINYTNENPWLWGVYIVVIGTPLSFIFYTVCCSKKVLVSVVMTCV